MFGFGLLPFALGFGLGTLVAPRYPAYPWAPYPYTYGWY